jgi:hypothetical protein
LRAIVKLVPALLHDTCSKSRLHPSHALFTMGSQLSWEGWMLLFMS